MPAPHGYPRLRALAKWLATALTVLLIAAWLLSGKFGIAHHRSSGYSASLWRGRVFLWQSAPPIPPRSLGFEFRGPTDFGLEWWMSSFKRYNLPLLAFPLWWLAAPALAATIALWRHDLIARRRAAKFHCPKCGYDLAGLARDGGGAKCPECGAGPTGG